MPDQHWHVVQISVYLLEIVVVISCLDIPELVAGWRAVRAAMEAESQNKGRSSYSPGPLQVTLRSACRWGDSDAESPSSTTDASTVSGWNVIEYTANNRPHRVDIREKYYGRVKLGKLLMLVMVWWMVGSGSFRKGESRIFGNLSAVVYIPALVANMLAAFDMLLWQDTADTRHGEVQPSLAVYRLCSPPDSLSPIRQSK